MSTRLDHALVTGLVAALSACAGPTGPPPVSETDTGGVKEALAVSPREARLSEQAQRDVEQLRRLDRNRVPATGGDPQAVAEPPEVQWILPRSQRAAPAEPPARPGRAAAKVGRNDPCPCGSGKKYKKCCGK